MDVTHAKVKFKDDNFITEVSIHKIVEFKNNIPLTLKDFEKDKLYTCLWTDEKNPVEVELPVQIAELAIIETEEDKIQFTNKRGIFQKLSDSVIDEYYTDKELKKNFEENSKKETGPKKVLLKKSENADRVVQTQILSEKCKTLIETNTLSLKLNSQIESQSEGCIELFNNIDTSELQSNDIRSLKVDHDYLMEQYRTLLTAHNNLKSRYNEAKLKIETLQCLNEKLQIQLLLKPDEAISLKKVDNTTNKLEQKKLVKKSSSSLSSFNLDCKKDCTDDDVHKNLQYNVFNEKSCSGFSSLSLDDDMTDAILSEDDIKQIGKDFPNTSTPSKRTLNHDSNDSQSPIQQADVSPNSAPKTDVSAGSASTSTSETRRARKRLFDSAELDHSQKSKKN